MIWLLLFNCTVLDASIQSTNLVFQLEQNYSTEEACLRAAEKGVRKTKGHDCYFTCAKGFRSK
jgi:hypothetical protein